MGELRGPGVAFLANPRLNSACLARGTSARRDRPWCPVPLYLFLVAIDLRSFRSSAETRGLPGVEQSHHSCESAVIVKGAHIFGIVDTPALLALFAGGIPGTDRDGPWVR